MNLSDEDKKRIEEEEAYRRKLREEEKYREGLKKEPNKSPLWKKWWTWLIFIVAVFLVANAFNQAPKLMERARESANTSNKQIFDVPALVGKNLDGVITVLGTPKGQDPTALQIQQGITEWDKTFVKDGKELLVTYTISNRKIVDFFISADDPSGKTTNTTNLLQLGNLREGDSRYRIEFVRAIKDPNSFTGVKIIPK